MHDHVDPQIGRREFIASAAAFGLGASAAAADGDAPPRPSSPTHWTKGPVVLAADEASGGRYVQNFTCPAEPLDDGRIRLWYSISGKKSDFNVGFAEGVPGDRLTRFLATLSEGPPADAPFAIGNLPTGWRPVQPVHLLLPDGRHRLYFWAHGPGVARYLVAESRDGRRYRVLDAARPCLYHPSDRAVGRDAATDAGLPSFATREKARPEGEPPARAGLVSNDAAVVYAMPEGGFELYSVGLVEVPKGDPRYVGHDNAAGLVRVIDRRTSDDGVAWSDRRRILTPDADDPADLQFYYLSVTRTDRGRVGMLGHYRVRAQTMDLEWCTSRDGIAWERPARRAWIDRGPPGEPDSYGIYAPHGLVRRDDRWWLFYTGVNESHNGKDAHGRPSSVVRVASTPTLWA